MLRLTRALARETGQKNLCLAGGVALNCVANGKILRDGQFERIWIQPAAGDAGGALGAALAAYHLFKDQPRKLERRARRHAAAPISARPSRRTRSSGACARRRRGVRRASPTTTMIDATVDALADEQGGRLVPGPHGVRAARARRALDPRRCALADHAADAQSQGQVPRDRSGRSRRRCCARTSPTGSSSTTTARTCCWSPTSSTSAAALMNRGRAGAVRDRQAERAALARSRRSPTSTTRRASRPCTPTPTRATTPAQRVQGAHRLPGPGQHQLQRARRADRLHARGRLPLLHGHRDRGPGRRQLRAATRSGRTRP